MVLLSPTMPGLLISRGNRKQKSSIGKKPLSPSFRAPVKHGMQKIPSNNEMTNTDMQTLQCGKKTEICLLGYYRQEMSVKWSRLGKKPKKLRKGQAAMVLQSPGKRRISIGP